MTFIKQLELTVASIKHEIMGFEGAYYLWLENNVEAQMQTLYEKYGFLDLEANSTIKNQGEGKYGN